MIRVAINKRTAKLVEVTSSFMGDVIWLKDYGTIDPRALAIYPLVIYSDDKRFNDYEILGEL